MYPGDPGDNVLQHVVDVRGMMDDPAEKFPKTPGTNPEVQEYVLSQPGVNEWIELELRVIRQWIVELASSQFEKLRIYFMCRGGYQRSVTLATAITNRLREEFGSQHTINLEHLSVDLTHRTKISPR